MNKHLYRAKLKEIRDIAKDPNAASGVHVSGKRWHTTPNNAIFSTIKLKGDGQQSIKLVFGQRDLYLQGFITPQGAFRFTDATWNIAATNIGYTSDYTSMGWDRISAYPGFSFGDIEFSIANVMNCSSTKDWAANKQSVVKLVIAFIEGARMHSIQALVEEGSAISTVKWSSPENELALVKG